MTIIAAADGSALGNPGPAGWAWTIDDSTWASGGWRRGTNNQGELTAVLDLLRQTAHVDDELLIYCDSQYVINSITKWMPGWKRKGWKKADGKPVLNVEIMKALDEAMQGRRVRLEWVRGHAGHPLNEAADTLANSAAQAMAKGRRPDSGPGYPGATAVGAGDDPAAPPPAAGGATDSAAPTGAGPAAGTGAEPDLFTEVEDDPAPSDDADAIAEVAAAELELLTAQVQRDRTRLTRRLDLTWRLVDVDGREWTRRELVADPSPLSGLVGRIVDTRMLGEDLIQVRWKASRDGEGPKAGTSVRISLWKRIDETWKQIYQQATIVG